MSGGPLLPPLPPFIGDAASCGNGLFMVQCRPDNGVGDGRNGCGDGERRRLTGGCPCASDSDSTAIAWFPARAACWAASIFPTVPSGRTGQHFPDTDPQYADADSLDLLARACAAVLVAGWRIGNVDVTVMTERPYLADHRSAMAANLAGVLGVEPTAVSVKATRGEGLGPEGRGEAVTVHAVALLRSLQ